MSQLNIHQQTRNAEYYNLLEQSEKLYKYSSKGYKFKKLYNLIFNKENILLAYRNLKTNKGSNTPGIDGLTIRHISTMEPSKIIRKINRMASNYKPSMIRRVYIPKSNGKKRPIGIPSIWDRLFQQCIKQVLEPICEAKFNKNSFGFRLDLSAPKKMH